MSAPGPDSRIDRRRAVLLRRAKKPYDVGGVLSGATPLTADRLRAAPDRAERLRQRLGSPRLAHSIDAAELRGGRWALVATLADSYLIALESFRREMPARNYTTLSPLEPLSAQQINDLLDQLGEMSWPRKPFDRSEW